MSIRKTKSLFGASLRDAIQNDRPSLKSEDLPSFRPFYVDRLMLDQLHNNSNQLVVGRRGTGKTHLLGTFNEFVQADCPNDMSLMISIMEVFPMTPPSHDTESKGFSRKRLAKTMYEGFLHRFFDKFLVQADARLKQLQKIHADVQLQESVNNLLQRLLEVIELGVPHIKKKTNRRTQRGSSTSKQSKGAAAMLQIARSGIAGKLEANLGGNTSDSDTDESVTDTESILAIDVVAVRDILLEILDKLKIDVLYILIDEWMELDKRTPSQIQPLFAQYLKTTFFNSKKFAVKIASVWHQTTLYDKDDLERSRGIQLNHDITHDLDLDTAFITSPTEVEDFCKQLLFKRLSFQSEELLRLCTNDHVEDLFITEIFDNKDNFKAFITASHGIPRDMMQIFHKCSVMIRRDFESQCISHDLIFEVARKKYSADKRKSIDPNSSAQELLRQINQYMADTGRRLFIVENQKAQSAALRKLIDEELIHQVPSSVTPRCIQDTHKVLQIDFGNYVDWIKTKSNDVSSLLKETVLADFPDDFDNDWQTYVVDVERVEVDATNCPHCQKRIKKSHPVFKKHGLCPTCGESPL